MKMKKCGEFGKTLGFFEGYHHPTLGKNHLLCSPCFNQISESVDKWRKVVLPYVDFFNNCQSNGSLQSNWENKITDIFKTKNMVRNIG